jgi:hypothetical protein
MKRADVRPRVRRRPVTIAGVAVALTAIAGVALAYFTSHGSGTVHTATGTLSVSIAAAAGTPGSPLYPGGTGDVTLQVNNVNPFAVTLTSVAGDGAITASAGCTAPDLTFSNQTSLNITIPASTSNYQVDLAGAAQLSTASPNNCQGATFSIPVTITVEF